MASSLGIFVRVYAAMEEMPSDWEGLNQHQRLFNGKIERLATPYDKLFISGGELGGIAITIVVALGGHLSSYALVLTNDFLVKSKEVVGYIGSEISLMLDALLSDVVGGASAASLTFMVGGPVIGLKAAMPVVNTMRKRVVHSGGSGNGSTTKVCNNLTMAISMAGVSEAFALGQPLGIDALTLSNIFNSFSARCWSSDTYNLGSGVMDGVPASRDYKDGFSYQLIGTETVISHIAARSIVSSTTILAMAGSRVMFMSRFSSGYRSLAVLPRDLSQQVFSELVHRQLLNGSVLGLFLDCALQIHLDSRDSILRDDR